MQELLAKIPLSYVWVGVVCWGLGIWTSWRFARYVERFHDAVRHAKHHYGRALDFVQFAKTNIVGMFVAGCVFLAIVGVVGLLVVARVTS